MSYTRANKAPDCTSVALFKAWAQWMADAIVACGWVRTADTGQVNWAGLGAVPSGAGTYEVYAMNDDLQATMPVVMRIDYYATGTNPRVNISVGIGSNGTGGILNAFQGAGSLPANTGATDTTARDCMVCGSSSMLSLLMWRDSPNSVDPFGIYIDRSRDEDGVQTDEYASVYAFGNSNHRWLGFGAKPGTGMNYTPALDVSPVTPIYPLHNANWNFQGNVAISPVFPVALGRLGNPVLPLVACRDVDATEGEVKTVSIYGASHDYLFSKGSSARAWVLSMTNYTAVGSLME